jgi:hypothetical protein
VASGDGVGEPGAGCGVNAVGASDDGLDAGVGDCSGEGDGDGAGDDDSGEGSGWLVCGVVPGVSSEGEITGDADGVDAGSEAGVGEASTIGVTAAGVAVGVFSGDDVG